jgi:hypothetical protein
MSYQVIFHGFHLLHYLLCHTLVVAGFVCCTKLIFVVSICLLDMWHQVTFYYV